MEIHSLKVIWNITKKCGYTCDICATHSDRTELSFEEKKNALASIMSIGTDRIEQIDFSGGDPLFDEYSIPIVREAIDTLGKEKVSITTTGKGLYFSLTSGVDLFGLLTNCEITMDPIYNAEQSIRNDTSYVSSNKDAFSIIERFASQVTLNIPIIDSTFDRNSVRQIIDEIEQINVQKKSVNLIRLMRVGRMSKENPLQTTNPQDFVNLFTEYASKSSLSEVHIHCALRGRIKDAHCNMLLEKIGIDCAGNVFACSWGGYLGGYTNKTITSNPFYLGNLLTTSLSEILNGTRAKDMLKQIRANPTHHCRVYCYQYNYSHNIFLDSDPIFS